MTVHGNSWSEAKRVEVATAHMMGLKAPMIEVATGVPCQTVRHWRMSDWFKDLVSELQREDDIEVDAKLTKLVGKSLDAVVDRLENGDFMYDPKSGSFKRRPLYVKDITRVADIMFDKRNLLRGKPTSISGKQEQISDRLLKLAVEFERFVSAKDVTPLKEQQDALSITETAPVHALPETRTGQEMGQGIPEIQTAI